MDVEEDSRKDSRLRRPEHAYHLLYSTSRLLFTFIVLAIAFQSGHFGAYAVPLNSTMVAAVSTESTLDVLRDQPGVSKLL